MTNFCSNCGNEVKQIEARFCVNCGHTLLNTKSNVNEHETHTHSNSEINIFLDIYNKISNFGGLGLGFMGYTRCSTFKTQI